MASFRHRIRIDAGLLVPAASTAAAATAVAPGPAAGPPADPAATSRALVRNLERVGLAHGEAGNLVALLHGLRPVRSGWTAHEIEHLRFLRALVEGGQIEH